MGHPQPTIPFQTYNTTAHSFVTKSLNPKTTKSTDLNYWYMRDKQDQKKFNYYWRKGKRNNNADYHTKHHVQPIIARFAQGTSPPMTYWMR